MKLFQLITLKPKILPEFKSIIIKRRVLGPEKIHTAIKLTSKSRSQVKKVSSQPLTPKSDEHLISPYNLTPKSRK